MCLDTGMTTWFAIILETEYHSAWLGGGDHAFAMIEAS